MFVPRSRGPAAALAIAAVLTGCAGSSAIPSLTSNEPEASVAEAPSSDAASAAPSGASAVVVGVWQGVHDCAGIAQALTDAGFSTEVVVENIVGNGLLPSVESPEDITAACAESSPLEHSHEFTADGRFYSYDQDGQEVDFGTYEVIDADTLVIGAPDRPDVEFDFAVNADELTLTPRLPAGCQEFECQWATMVAMSWTTMERVEG